MGDGVFIACEIEPLRLEPGESYRIQASLPEAGSYRIVVPYGWTEAKNPDASITTDRFEVH